MKIFKIKKINFSTFSLSFILVGMPIVYILREYIPISKALLTYLITFVLLIGLIDFNNLINLKFFNAKPRIFILTLMLNIIIFITYSIGYNQIFNNIQSIFIILILFIFIALSTHQNKDFKNLLLYILIISSFTTFISLTLNTNEWMLRSRFYVGDTNNPNLSSFIALVNILSISYFLYKQNRVNYIIKFILILIEIASFYIYLISFSKSAILGLLFSIIFLIFIERNFIFTLIKKLIYIGLIAVPILFILFPDIIDKINDNMQILFYAYNSYLYGQEGSMSAEIRHNNLKEMFTLLPSIDLLNGYGIFKTRADQPILQVFTDLGILPGIINLFAMFIFPLIILINALLVIRSYKTDRLYVLYIFSIMIFLFYFPNSLFHGTPYEHTQWIPILMLYKFVPWKKKRNKYVK